MVSPAVQAPGMYDGSGTNVLVAASSTRVGAARVVGARGALRSLVSWCVQVGLPCDALVVLDSDEVRVDPASVSRLAAQLRRIGQVLREWPEPVPAVGWVRRGVPGLAGGVLGRELAEPGVPVLTGHGLVVAARRTRDGACLELRSAAGAVRQLTEWVSSAHGVVDTGGQTLGRDGVVLGRLGEGEFTVRAVPATSVVAGLLTSLHELAQECATTAVPLVVSGAGVPLAEA